MNPPGPAAGRGTYRHLFTPLRLGPLTVANRIVFCAHLTNYADNGRPTAQHAAYYAARAAGGAGLIITEEHSTHPTDRPYEKLIEGYAPGVVDDYRRLTDAVHAHDVPILAQLNHNGGQASSMYTRLPVWAPSPIADPLFGEVPKAVEEHEITEITDAYAQVAAHCVAGGFDGVELQCSHSSIVRAFLSPATNHRTDRWGGPLPNRARLLLHLIDAVRAAVGPDRVVGVRLCGDELIEGGTTIDEAVEVARMVDATGQVDYLNTSIGVATHTLHMVEASMRVPPGYAAYIPTAIRAAVRLPVVGVGRFKDPLQADRALGAGHADLVGVVRGQIADPDFAAKARSGHAEEIRTCLSCNQECVGRMGLNRWLGCIENPHAGHEAAPADSAGA
ncbi:oxidoreductase, partial [Nocardiopsis gilva]